MSEFDLAFRRLKLVTVVAMFAATVFGFTAGRFVSRCDCSLPATTGAGQGALDRG